MKKSLSGILLIIALVFSCKTTGTIATIQPKSGIIELTAKGELRIWQGSEHPSFSVTLNNSATTQSCEVYNVTANGNERWISPSLQAGKALTLKVSSNGHLFFKNFNDNILKIDYQIKE